MNCGERKAQLTFSSFWRGHFDHEPVLTLENVLIKKKPVNTFYRSSLESMLIYSPQRTLGLWSMYTTPLKDFFIFFPSDTTSFDQHRKKREFARQILYNNLSICPRKWSPYNTHHREAKDTQVKSTLKSRLSTNQTLSNRLLGAVRCFVSSSLIEGEPVCVWRSRKHSSFSVSSNRGSNPVVHCSGAAEQKAVIDWSPTR